MTTPQNVFLFCSGLFFLVREAARKKTNTLAVILATYVMLIGGTSCTSTVTPEIVEPTQASYSGVERNSSVIQRIASGWIVDGNFRARYNALIEDYGEEFLPRLRRDAGLVLITAADAPSDERWLMDPQHFEQMLKMNIEKHSGLAPLKK